jgi:hypothetical protein
MKLSESLFTRKYEGDDLYSWAVFAKGHSEPLVTGCSRADARYHKRRLEEMYRQRGQ